MPTTLSKADLRSQLRARRDTIHTSERIEAATSLARHIMEFAGEKEVTTIAGYVPMKGEIDIMPTLALLASDGMNILLPAVMLGDPLLQLHPWRPGEPLQDGPFGTKHPISANHESPITNHEVPTLILVPLLGFDTRLHRLGYGKGYYDASLRYWKQQNPRLLTLGAAFACQQTDEIPIHEGDIALDAVATEKGIIVIRDS